MQIKRSQDIEYIVQQALKTGLTAYCRPLPKDFKTPSILVTLVGGTRLNEIDTFDLVLDSRAETDAEANEYLRNAIGVLEAVCNEQTTAIRHVVLNSIGAWEEILCGLIWRCVRRGSALWHILKQQIFNF